MIARHINSAIPRPIPRPMPTLAELFNPKEVKVLAGASDEVGCFEENHPVLDAEAVKVDSPMNNDPVKVGGIETVALVDEVLLRG